MTIAGARKRLGTLVVGIVILGSALAADAQQARRIPTVGCVVLLNEPSEPRWRDGFQRGLRDLGYVPGKTIDIDVRTYATQDELRAALDELVRRRVDVLFVGPPSVAQAAKRATRDIPIVCGSCGDPTDNGLAESLARPGGNVTGLASLSAELIGKRLELMKEMLPGISRVAVVVFPANPGTPATLRGVDAPSRALGLEVKRIEVSTPSDFDGAFRAAARSRVGAVLLQDDPLLRTVGPQIAELAVKHRLPLSTGVSELVDAGALMAYGPDRVDLYRRAAGFIDKLLRGARVAELPFEQATKFDLILNLKTAQALGVTIKPSFTLRAVRIIE